MSPLLRTWAGASFVGLLLSANLAAAGEVADAEQAILRLHDSGKLYDKAQYRAVRAAFARLFEAQHAEAIRQAFGEDQEALGKWLDARPDLKEDFYTALDERYDRVGPALALFRDLWKKFPEQLAKHPQLGIAVAVTWDDPGAVYDYRPHQERTKSTMPDGLLDGPANFQYVVENEKVTEGRCRYLPWEFLVFVVDHPTPLAERKWAQQYYQTNRASKSWHQDVPYDRDMLQAEKARGAGDVRPKLQGHDYTLSNIHKFGGVCAMQADFAAHVGKSVGVPAVYCWGSRPSAAPTLGGCTYTSSGRPPTSCSSA
jgi:hypothetical protein